MRITYLDVPSVESGFEPPFSQMSSVSKRESEFCLWHKNVCFTLLHAFTIGGTFNDQVSVFISSADEVPCSSAVVSVCTLRWRQRKHCLNYDYEAEAELIKNSLERKTKPQQTFLCLSISQSACRAI